MILSPSSTALPRYNPTPLLRRASFTGRRAPLCAATPGGLPPVTDQDLEATSRAKPVGVEKTLTIAARMNHAWKHRCAQLMAEVMPQERGDARDWALMYTSVAVFVFMAMQMFRVYAYWYYAAGLRPIMQTFH